MQRLIVVIIVVVVVVVVIGDVNIISRDETGGGVAQLATHHARFFLGELELVAQVRLALQTLLEVASQLLQLMRLRR